MVRMVSDCETQIVAVERVKEFVDIPAERSVEPVLGAPPPTAPLPPDWPYAGAISVRALSLAYRESTPFVLHDLNLEVGDFCVVRSAVMLVFLRGGPTRHPYRYVRARKSEFVAARVLAKAHCWLPCFVPPTCSKVLS
jgi:ABC-type multidrug transport system fused ATPase/permease subunit